MDLKTFLTTENIAQFADAVGVSRQVMSNYKSGKHLPSLKTAIAIEDASGGMVTMRELAGEKKEENNVDSLI